MLGQLKWVQFALATVAVNMAVMRAATAAASHVAYYERALVREQRGQCPKGDAVSLLKDAHRCDCEPFNAEETFGGGRPSILFYEGRHDHDRDEGQER